MQTYFSFDVARFRLFISSRSQEIFWRSHLTVSSHVHMADLVFVHLCFASVIAESLSVTTVALHGPSYWGSKGTFLPLPTMPREWGHSLFGSSWGLASFPHSTVCSDLKSFPLAVQWVWLLPGLVQPLWLTYQLLQVRVKGLQYTYWRCYQTRIWVRSIFWGDPCKITQTTIFLSLLLFPFDQYSQMLTQCCLCSWQVWMGHLPFPEDIFKSPLRAFASTIDA